MSQTVSPASPSSEHLPPTVYQLVRLIDETPTRHLRSHEIPSELNNALIIALHYKLVENDLPSYPPTDLTGCSPEGLQLVGKIAVAWNQAQANPNYMLTEQGRLKLAQWLESKLASTTTDSGVDQYVTLDQAARRKVNDKNQTKGTITPRKSAKLSQTTINFSEMGIGFDPATGWHVFRFTSQGWKYARKKLEVPPGVLTHMLAALLQNSGILKKARHSYVLCWLTQPPKKI